MVVVEVVVEVVEVEVTVVEVIVVQVVEVAIGLSWSHIWSLFSSRQQPVPTRIYGLLHTGAGAEIQPLRSRNSDSDKTTFKVST